MAIYENWRDPYILLFVSRWLDTERKSVEVFVWRKIVLYITIRANSSVDDNSRITQKRPFSKVPDNWWLQYDLMCIILHWRPSTPLFKNASRFHSMNRDAQTSLLRTLTEESSRRAQTWSSPATISVTTEPSRSTATRSLADPSRRSSPSPVPSWPHVLRPLKFKIREPKDDSRERSHYWRQQVLR